jgi:hypothetical protein
LGFACVEIATACGPLQVSGIVVSQNCGSRFIGMPAGSYIVGGQAHYTNILKWCDGIDHFRDAVLALVERCDPDVFESGELALAESRENAGSS